MKIASILAVLSLATFVAAVPIEARSCDIDRPKPHTKNPHPVPKTHKPKTHKPKTHKPKTHKPKTQKPKTHKPKTQKPKTQKPKTHKPKTQKPKTHKPKPKPKDDCDVCNQSGDKIISQTAGGAGNSASGKGGSLISLDNLLGGGILSSTKNVNNIQQNANIN